MTQGLLAGPAWSRSHSLLLGLLLVLSAFLQFSVVARSEVVSPIRADAAVYFSYAYNLKHYGVYSSQHTWAQAETGQPPTPDALTTPGYPLFLLAVPGLELSQAYLDRVLYLQAGLGVLGVLLSVLIARTFLPPIWALLAGGLVALSPHLASISTYMLTEALFLSLLLASVLASIRAARSGRTLSWLLAGACWGACSLVRSTTQFLPALMLLATLVIPSLRRWHKPSLMVFLASLLVLSPWLIRNQFLPKVEGQPSLAINFLHYGSYPGFMYEGRPETLGYPYQFDPRHAADSASVPAVLRSIAGKFHDHPWQMSRWYLVGKPIMFLSWNNIPGIGDIYIYPMRHSPYVESGGFWSIRAVALTLHWPLMILGVLAALAVWLRPARIGIPDDQLLAARVVSLVLLYAIALHMVGAPFPRYGIPFRPMVYSLGLLLAFTIARGHRHARASVPGGAPEIRSNAGDGNHQG